MLLHPTLCSVCQEKDNGHRRAYCHGCGRPTTAQERMDATYYWGDNTNVDCEDCLGPQRGKDAAVNAADVTQEDACIVSQEPQ